MRPIRHLFFFVACMTLGYWVTVKSWGGYVYVYFGEERSPAALRSIKDYSAIDRKTLTNEVHQQLVGDAKLFKSEGFLGIRLGHPMLRGENGRKDFACGLQGRPGIFDRIEITFWGIGITESGDPPKLIIVSDCRADEDVNFLEPVWVPMREILASKPLDQEIRLFGEPPMLIRLEDIPMQWPESWVMTSIRLYQENDPEEELEIGASLIKEAHTQILSFDWQP